MSSNFLKVGITGGIGSGKSFIASILEKMNFPVFYSDAAAKEIITQNQDVKKQIISLLGQDAYVGNVYNTKYVSEKVFANEYLLTSLNGIVHPAVREHFENWAIAKSEYSDIVFNEAAIMIESGSYQHMNDLILVSAPLDVRLKRVINRDQITKDHALARLNAQSSDEFKRKFAKYEVINDGRALLPQLLKIIDSIRL